MTDGMGHMRSIHDDDDDNVADDPDRLIALGCRTDCVSALNLIDEAGALVLAGDWPFEGGSVPRARVG
jgi:hypothetical protein